MMSQITTHVLDTTRGLPAQKLPISLFAQTLDGWQELAKGITNTDGRITDLLANDVVLPAGVYRMHFATKTYFDMNNEQGFYPFVDIVFELDGSNTHYHIPLLLTAFGYSTYRGS
ncbi:hydroxyisourate hydrolase [Colwellia sp. 1_MG-2023]|jgi:5-hydroxyisourate hydrolase|uniref:hydroxyisourate hydrolase n=1 Tax=unclassified Colwellia TaxID=196834 RepID=UPI00209049A6|nr:MULTISPECIES: hydroxyisourate hydrolase [unclassified Colwellia]MDO6488816.1 hydroxyisourate hydrolase [Colwellia sp. 6_MG-2023]MDO6653041.1 hydroxyisourate hydrolase [Colwellia sp. 3_MG-2023]MDO6665972.1 hydroxyisourate hydrolase [Colwellia sp. 2_MG-2023]MDO6690345.1 hydroxyisourate hydrolase [Colwellia sp. 1_MG-2023]